MIIMPINVMLARSKHKIKILIVNTFFFPSILVPLLLHFFVTVIWVWVWVLFVCFVSLKGLTMCLLWIWTALYGSSCPQPPESWDYRCESLIQSSDATSHALKSREKRKPSCRLLLEMVFSKF